MLVVWILFTTLHLSTNSCEGFTSSVRCQRQHYDRVWTTVEHAGLVSYNIFLAFGQRTGAMKEVLTLSKHAARVFDIAAARITWSILVLFTIRL